MVCRERVVFSNGGGAYWLIRRSIDNQRQWRPQVRNLITESKHDEDNIVWIVIIDFESRKNKATFYIALKSTESAFIAYRGSPTGHNQPNILFSTLRKAL